MNKTFDVDTPAVSIQEIQKLMTAELSLRSRLGYTALLLVSLASTGLIGTLWLTEQALAARTHIAFALMVGIGLSWTMYAVWVLTRRRVLLAGHRIVAARMAIAFSTVFMTGFAVLGVLGRAGPAAFPAAGFGLIMLAVAVGLLVQARREFARLIERRRVLELQLARLNGSQSASQE